MALFKLLQFIISPYLFQWKCTYILNKDFNFKYPMDLIKALFKSEILKTFQKLKKKTFSKVLISARNLLNDKCLFCDEWDSNPHSLFRKKKI